MNRKRFCLQKGGSQEPGYPSGSWVSCQHSFAVRRGNKIMHPDSFFDLSATLLSLLTHSVLERPPQAQVNYRARQCVAIPCICLQHRICYAPVATGSSHRNCCLSRRVKCTVLTGKHSELPRLSVNNTSDRRSLHNNIVCLTKWLRSKPNSPVLLANKVIVDIRLRPGPVLPPGWSVRVLATASNPTCYVPSC